MSILNFLGVAHSEMGSVILEKREITLYSQRTESRNSNFKSIKYGLFFVQTNGLTHFFKVIGMLNPKTNVCKLRNGVLLSLFACFQDGRQNHTESYNVVDSLFNVPGNISGGSVFVFVLLCITLCSFYFVNTLTRKRMIVTLL